MLHRKLMDGTSSLQISRLQPLKGQDAKEKASETVQDYIEKGVLFQPHHPWHVLRGTTAQQHTAKAIASSAPGGKGLHRHSGRNECPASLEAQPTRSTKSIQTHYVNSSSLKVIFKILATEFQQIMTAQCD
jgi:hypothetical protein